MRSDKPLLSVLIPAYNAGMYIEDTIRSILLQTYDHVEILVGDDFSDDNTYEVLEKIKHPKIRVFKNAERLTKNGTTNFLLRQASGEYITVHDADDISLPGRFEKQMDFFLRHPDCAMCGTNFISFLNNGKIIERSDLETEDAAIREKIKIDSQFHGPTVIFRRDIIDKVGGLYRYMSPGEDIDFTMRVTQKYKVANLRDYLYLYRHVSTSLTNNLKGYSIERLAHWKLLFYLHNERERTGKDTLMLGGIHIDSLMRELSQEFQEDPTIALRRGVFRLLGMKMYKNAVFLSLTALRKKVNVLNLKCVLYAVPVAIYGCFSLWRIKDKVDLSFLNEPGETIVPNVNE